MANTHNLADIQIRFEYQQALEEEQLYASILGMDLRYFGNETDEIEASARLMRVQNSQSNQLCGRMTRLLQMLHVRPDGGGGATPSNIGALLLTMTEVIERAELRQQARLE